MLLDFSAMAVQTISHFKGGEKELSATMYTDDDNRILFGKLEPGASIGMHCHDTGSEIVHILSGEGTAICDEDREALRPGVCHYCPKGHSHSILNTGDEDLLFFAVVPQH